MKIKKIWNDFQSPNNNFVHMKVMIFNIYVLNKNNEKRFFSPLVQSKFHIIVPLWSQKKKPTTYHVYSSDVPCAGLYVFFVSVVV